MKRLITILFAALVLSSCDRSFIYEQNREMNSGAWHKDSIQVFTTDSLTALELGKAIKIGFNVRNTVDYNFRNLWLFVELELPNGQSIKDTLDHVMMDAQGYWMDGVKGGSSVKESRIYYPYGITNPPAGVYRIKIQHGMRMEALPEILSVGARIEELPLP